MSDKLAEYLTNYIQERIGVYKKYIIAAFNSKDHCIWYLESSAGMPVPSSDLKNCELLRDAKIFTEDTRISRNGRSIYKVFCLTDFGKQLAKEILKENQLASEVDEPVLGEAGKE
ncbi:MAG: hypothetical protein QXP44_01485 [Candidatus Bathyarchaeia archaeon]